MTLEDTSGRLGDVWELTSDGVTATSRLLYKAGSPEAEAFSAKYGDPDNPVDLEPAEPVA